jgi:hypothetical protein
VIVDVRSSDMGKPDFRSFCVLQTTMTPTKTIRAAVKTSIIGQTKFVNISDFPPFRG